MAVDKNCSWIQSDVNLQRVIGQEMEYSSLPPFVFDISHNLNINRLFEKAVAKDDN